MRALSWLKERWILLTLLGLSVIAVAVVVVLYTCRHTPPVGTYIALGGIAAAIMAARGEHADGKEKAMWICLITILMAAEIAGIYRADKDQAQKFDAILSGLDSTKKGLDATATDLKATGQKISEISTGIGGLNRTLGGIQRNQVLLDKARLEGSKLKVNTLGLSGEILQFVLEHEQHDPRNYITKTDQESLNFLRDERPKYLKDSISQFNQQFRERIDTTVVIFAQRKIDVRDVTTMCQLTNPINDLSIVRSCALAIQGLAEKIQ